MPTYEFPYRLIRQSRVASLAPQSGIRGGVAAENKNDFSAFYV